MPKSKRKRPVDMTNDEIARRVLPRRVREEVKAEVGKTEKETTETSHEQEDN